MKQLSRRANSLAHLDSKSQSPFLVSSSLATAPPPSAQAQRRGPGPLPHGVQTPTNHHGAGGVCLREPRPALRAKNLVGLGTAQVPAR